MLALLAGGASQSANAAAPATVANTLKAVYPDNEYFFAGLYQGRDFDTDAAAAYGKGSSAYYAAVDAEIASAQESLSGSASGSDDYYFWWGYRTGLQQGR